MSVFTELGRWGRTGTLNFQLKTKISSIHQVLQKASNNLRFQLFIFQCYIFQLPNNTLPCLTISLIEISSVCGKADMGETKAFCLHNTSSHHTSKTPVSIVVLVRHNKNSVRPAKLSFCS